MTNIEKFYSDVQKIKKHNRQENNGKSNYFKIKNNIQNLFEKNCNVGQSLANSCYEYWEKNYIETSSEIDFEPNDENLIKLCSILTFLNGEDENENRLTKKDWKEIGQLVNFEAEDLDVYVLQELMKILVSKGSY